MLIFRYKYQLFFIFSTFELYDWIKSFDKITVIPRMSFRNINTNVNINTFFNINTT